MFFGFLGLFSGVLRKILDKLIVFLYLILKGFTQGVVKRRPNGRVFRASLGAFLYVTRGIFVRHLGCLGPFWAYLYIYMKTLGVSWGTFVRLFVEASLNHPLILLLGLFLAVLGHYNDWPNVKY